ncbi:uncharacterized protein LOC135084634 [Ostrinia nubilalis]|uniref:uncharacterized protein LOC135084634 n=1 Tax=Ostrinia nubilalis TaxID=29057 RepID=UPI00308228CC
MLVFLVLSLSVHVSGFEKPKESRMALGSHKHRFEDSCDNVCTDIPKEDLQPICMMFSRYKKGYQFFVNQCHARRAICKENLVLHIVHPSRCIRNRQFFMPVN